MTKMRERTLKPWRQRLGLWVLGVKAEGPTWRVEVQANQCLVWDQPNPHDLGLAITYTHGEDVHR